MPNPFIDGFLKALELENKSVYTVESYKYDLNIFELWLKTEKRRQLHPNNLTCKTILDYRNHMVNDERSKPNTVNRKLATLSRFSKWCLQEKYIKSDPTINIKGARKSALSPKSLIETDLNKFLNSVNGFGSKRDIAIAILLVNTGLRVGELVKITLSDIDLRPKKGSMIIRGKGRKSRIMPLNEDARMILKEYLSVRPGEKDNHLFIGKRGTGIKESGIWRVINKYAKQSGIKLSPHTLRHTFGRKLINKVDIVTVQSLLGHKQLNTTALYLRPGQRDFEHAVEDLPEITASQGARK